MNYRPTPVTRPARASAPPDSRRWLFLSTVGLAQLMVICGTLFRSGPLRASGPAVTASAGAAAQQASAHAA